DDAGVHGWTDLVCPELERCDDAEVATPAPKCPEQLRVLVLADMQVLAVCGHDVGPDEVVTRQPTATNQPADPSAESESGDSRGGDEATGEGEPERLRLRVNIAPQAAGLRRDGPPVRVDPHSVHRREVEDHTAVAGREARDAVPAAPHRDGQTLTASELDAGQHVGHTVAPDDQRRLLVMRTVPDRSRLVVRRIPRA